MMKERNNAPRDRDHYIGLGIGIGLILFAPLGVVLLILTDSPGFLGIGPGMGVAVGVAIGEGLYQRSKQDESS